MEKAMREIACKDITDTVAKLAIQACCHLPCDMAVSYTHLTLPTNSRV